MDKAIREYMAEIGRRGGKATGRKGLAALSPERQAEIRQLAEAARKLKKTRRKKVENSA